MDQHPQVHAVSAPLSRRAFLRNAAIATASVAALQAAGPGMTGLAAASPAARRGTLPQGGAITGVVSTTDRTLAVGHEEGGRVQTWTRGADGEWTVATPSGDFDGATVLGLAAVGSGYAMIGYRETRQLVETAVGEEGEELPVIDRQLAPAAWFSADGTSWETADTPATAAVALDVAASPDGLLAVGATLDGETLEGFDPFLMRSGDGGRTWRRVDAQGLPATPEGGLQGVTHTRGTWYALSADFDGAAVWTSADGTSWSEHASFPAGEVPAALTDAPGGVVAVGATIPELEPRIWRIAGGQVRAQRVPDALSDGDRPAVVRDVAEADGNGTLLLVGERAGQALATDTEL
jgi:hypothetical protein